MAVLRVVEGAQSFRVASGKGRPKIANEFAALDWPLILGEWAHLEWAYTNSGMRPIHDQIAFFS